MKDDIMKIEIKDVHGILYPIEISQLYGPTVAAVYAVLLAASENNIAELSCNEIARQVGIKSRKTVGGIIKKLESLELVERYYNDGYAPRYYVKNVMLDEINLVEQRKPKPPEQVPARRSERGQTYQPNSVECVWRASNGGLKQGYKWYGEREKVALTDDEYQKLCEKFGESVVKDYIHRIEINRAKNGTYYPDYAAAIEDWIEYDDREIKRRQSGKDKPISSKKRKQLDQYLAGVNVFEDDIQVESPMKAYGKFKHVLLSDDDYNYLCKNYGKMKTNEYIQMVDTYRENYDVVELGSAKNKVESFMDRDLKKYAEKKKYAEEYAKQMWQDLDDYGDFTE